VASLPFVAVNDFADGARAQYLSEVIWKGSIERDAELQKFEQLKLETSFKHENVTRSKENKQ
jgi:hypothetical protein